jgi:hypothetical protein
LLLGPDLRPWRNLARKDQALSKDRVLEDFSLGLPLQCPSLIGLQEVEVAAMESTQSMAAAAAAVAAAKWVQDADTEASRSGGCPQSPSQLQKERTSPRRTSLQLRKSVTFSGVMTIDEEGESLEDRAQEGQILGPLNNRQPPPEEAASRSGSSDGRDGAPKEAAGASRPRRPTVSPFASPFAEPEPEAASAEGAAARPPGDAEPGASSSAQGAQEGRKVGHTRRPPFKIFSAFAADDTRESNAAAKPRTGGEDSSAKNEPIQAMRSPFAPAPSAEVPAAAEASPVFRSPHAAPKEEKSPGSAADRPHRAAFAGIRSPFAES